MMDEPRHSVVEVFVRLLKALRLKNSMTLEQVADLAGVHRTHVGLIERLERQPTVSVALQIARAMNVELSELVLKAELVDAGKLKENDAFREIAARVEKPQCLRNTDSLETLTGLNGSMLLASIHGCYSMLDTIDSELTANGAQPISRLVELANLSSMVGNMLGGSIAECSEGLYKRNRPHAYPDLLPLKIPAKNLELKVALEKNRPKGHLPKPGTYLTFRYVLGDSSGEYVKKERRDTVWIWEVRVGNITKDDFDISNTAGDSGKTAVLKNTVFNQMKLVYFDSKYCPFSSRQGEYPGYN